MGDPRNAGGKTSCRPRKMEVVSSYIVKRYCTH
jgi:hypothetical protein